MLIPETEALWQYLREHDSLRGFVLIGGSGLALRIQHRLSEDLDFVWNGLRLPRKRIDLLVREAGEAGFHFVSHDDLAAFEEFEIAGMDLHDYQQDFVVNDRVKVTLFTADSALSKILPESPSEPCRIATLQELFETKALVSASRSKSRDWFDLYILMRDHGFTLADYASTFAKAGCAILHETGLSRLCSGVPQRNDEGFEELVSPAPSIGELAGFFRERRDAYEIALAAAARRAAAIGGQEANTDLPSE
ncbi:MAG TPA: nucleotidyl transferase AbiEii/AbiGii toxin family protein [Bacteroidia bacterium]|nr:nucleotidyl transferase AbiEii/AbiGii toxin family protein [Bacteroidia bacterium]